MAKCRTCKHWRPLFTGEVFGVRSFVDAPEDFRSKVLAKINSHDTFIGDLPGCEGRWTEGHRLPNWPEWGECALTELESEAEKQSLARAIDGSMYRAILQCHANFGCVQFQPLDAATS